MELFLHNKISEEQTLWWNLYSVTIVLLRSFNITKDIIKLHCRSSTGRSVP